MIESLTLENFQAHKKRVVQFDPRVTVVVGDTDTGKSAIIRALSWVATNKPSGLEFINWAATSAVVTLKVDGQTVVRSRSKKENAYSLNGDEFAAFGNDVPPQVAELLRLASINFQSQHDAPFWFSESAGEVSRRLNQVIDLGIIDDALSEAVSTVRDTRATVDVVEQRIRKAKADVESMAGTVELDVALTRVEEAYALWQRIKLKQANLAQLVLTANNLRTEAASARAFAKAGRRVIELRDALQPLSEKAQLLHELIVSAELLQKKAAQKAPSLGALTELKEHLERLSVKREALAAAIQRQRELWRARKAATTEYETAHTELHTKMKGACPVCGHDLP